MKISVCSLFTGVRQVRPFLQCVFCFALFSQGSWRGRSFLVWLTSCRSSSWFCAVYTSDVRRVYTGRGCLRKHGYRVRGSVSRVHSSHPPVALVVLLRSAVCVLPVVGISAPPESSSSHCWMFSWKAPGKCPVRVCVCTCVGVSVCVCVCVGVCVCDCRWKKTLQSRCATTKDSSSPLGYLKTPHCSFFSSFFCKYKVCRYCKVMLMLLKYAYVIEDMVHAKM